MKPVRPILDMNAYDGKTSFAQTKEGDDLLSRRTRNFGAASVLFYRDPIEMVSGSGCWMTAADGTSYLDFYNNVPSVGHCHPRVVTAMSEQAAKLNINSRYLHQTTEEYLDRLKATFPNYLENIVLTCSGSEANDLALRIAQRATGASGFIVTESAYHGNTAAVTDISPSALKRGQLPDHVIAIPAPSKLTYGDNIAAGFADEVNKAALVLQDRGYGVAALIADSIFSSDGVFSNPRGFLRLAVAVVHRAGGLFIADEVQPGFARTGDAFWGFARHDLVPDIVSMGKPMGNGFPMAGIAVRPELLSAFCDDVGYFNTFAASPVASATGLAVLNVIRDENLQANAALCGKSLREGLLHLADIDGRITDVRGAGLFIGVDLAPDGDPANPSGQLVSDIINAMRQNRVLIGAAGKYGQTLKIRPPLCLKSSEVDFFIEALAKSLRTCR
ncbi:aspartate aminotransferase family protein [Thalassospira indica]|uniref:Aspartate aminotransferase family protein n=1 Tax=Thalassospira indica TaxID=1891279 RepID=A0ABM6Y2S2_9PROT|nr:aspartate aminotransferase family protein [Thalassospira indica]AXO16220.1 aspartate aminotransferase family protein [Thalassospira indica]OAZ13847.1 4-aminobutyrate aminotransferase [Thalassospira profundimaris]